MKNEVAIESIAMKISTEHYVKFNICHLSDLRSSLNFIDVKGDGVNCFDMQTYFTYIRVVMALEELWSGMCCLVLQEFTGIASKCQYMFIRLHILTFQKTVFYTVTSVKTSDFVKASDLMCILDYS
jgi:hypothetical protein